MGKDLLIDIERPIVQQVLEIAEDIIRGNQVLDAKLLYYKAKRILKIDKKELLATIEFLIKKKILVEGSKLTKDLVLLNTHRKNIYNYIIKNHGANFSSIRDNYKGTTGSPGHLIWNLEMLLKFNYIKKIKFKKYTLFVPLNMEENTAIIYFILKDELNMKIIDLLLESEH